MSAGSDRLGPDKESRSYSVFAGGRFDEEGNDRRPRIDVCLINLNAIISADDTARRGIGKFGDIGQEQILACIPSRTQSRPLRSG